MKIGSRLLRDLTRCVKARPFPTQPLWPGRRGLQPWVYGTAFSARRIQEIQQPRWKGEKRPAQGMDMGSRIELGRLSTLRLRTAVQGSKREMQVLTWWDPS